MESKEYPAGFPGVSNGSNDKYLSFAASLLGYSVNELKNRCDASGKLKNMLGDCYDFPLSLYISRSLPSKEFSFTEEIVPKKVRLYESGSKSLILVADSTELKGHLEEILSFTEGQDLHLSFDNASPFLDLVHELCKRRRSDVTVLCHENKKRLGPRKRKGQLSLFDYTYKLHLFSPGWKEFFGSVKREIQKVSESLPVDKKLAPSMEKVYNCFDLCDWEKMKVIIVGQDPYTNPGQAMGLSFSVPKGVAIPPSLVNIFTEHRDEGFTSDNNGDLTRWARQGVLLLNMALTANEGKAKDESGSHLSLWNEFIIKLVEYITEKKNVVFVLWGKKAAELKGYISGESKVVMSSHPSPMATASKNSTFFGSKPFSKCNELLKELGLEEIDWNLKDQIEE